MSRGIPTLHGYGSWVPAHWDLRDPLAAHYPAAVADWLRRSLPTTSVCGLAARAGQWFLGLAPIESRPAVTPPPPRYPWRG
jgi:hypothetical protein